MLVASVVGQGACGEGSGPAGLTEAGSDADRQEGAAPADDAEADAPETIPAGWIRLPGVPTSCPNFIAPDSAHAHSAPTWTRCGDGCVEFSVPGPNLYTGIKAAKGAARGGTRYVGFQNFLGASGQVEVEIVRTNDNVVTFDGIGLDWLHGCEFLIDALTPENAMLGAFYPVGSDGKMTRYFRYALTPGESQPHLVFDRTDTTVHEATVVSDRLWASSYARAWALEWHDLSFATEAKVAWNSSDGRALFGLQAVGDTVLASTSLSGVSYATIIWNPTDGARPLVEYPSINQGGACCVRTDGIDIVWLEGAGWQRSDAGLDTFSEVWLMASPYVTRAADLKPRRLRRAHQGFSPAVTAWLAEAMR